MNREIDDWIRVFEVIEPQRHRKGFTVYKVISRVFHKKSIETITEMVSYKRFSEFKKLHKSLSHLHSSLHLKGVFPAFPDPKLFGRFEPEVIESRRQSALQLLEFAAKYPPLFTNSVFVKFFENSVTNFTTVSNNANQLLDSPADEDNHRLPEPIEPNLSVSDNWSQRSGDLDASDGSYYSTPIHSTDVSVNEENLMNKRNSLTAFDPLATNETPAVESTEEQRTDSKNWFICAIESSESETNICDKNDNNIEIPEPFADSKTLFSNIDTINETKCDTFVKQFTISCDDSDNTLEAEGLDKKSNDSLNAAQNAIQSEPEVKESNESNDTYLLDAAIILRQAQQHEDSEEWEPAFESYKCAVGILLEGVVKEMDSEKKASIRRKTYQYLTRAEQICDTYLSETNSFQSHRRWAPDSPFKSLNASLVQSWFGSAEELSKFKVIGIIDNRVQSVIDSNTNNIFVIKVIYKSNILDTNHSSNQLSANRLPSVQSIFPNDIPFMAQIYRIFKTEYALFLLLEFVKGGKLWDKISNKELGQTSPCPDCMFGFDDNDCQLIADNAYSGRRLSRARSESGANAFGAEHMSSIYETISEQKVLKKSDSVESYSPSGSLVSIDSIDCDIPSKDRYLSLCNSYAYNQKCADNSGLANLKDHYISDSIDSIDSITEYDSKPYVPYQLSNKDRNPKLSQSQRQSSTESLGITGLLAKARGILKNVDQTLNLTKYMTKTAPNFTSNRTNDLRESKSEMSLNFNQFNPKKISEVFHQMDDNSNGAVNRQQVTESEAKVWLSQMVRCLQSLHKLGIVYCDLKPENLLLSEDNELCISYKCFWNESPNPRIDERARERLYVAPELLKSYKINHLCDWWTFGVLAFELLTSRPLISYYPNGITSHTPLYFPVFISLEAKDLINKLLQPNPSERLGRHGAEEITTHPFFDGINWSSN